MKRLKIYWDNIVYFFTARNKFYRKRFNVLWGLETTTNKSRWVNIDERFKKYPNGDINLFWLEYKGKLINRDDAHEAFKVYQKKENRNNIIKEVLKYEN